MSEKEPEIRAQLGFAALFIMAITLLGSLLSEILSSDYLNRLISEPSNMALIFGAALGVGGAVSAVQYAHTLNKKSELRDFATHLLAETVIAEFHLSVIHQNAATMLKKAQGREEIEDIEVITQSLGYLQDGGILDQFSQYNLNSVRLGRLPFTIVIRVGALRTIMAQLKDVSNSLKARSLVAGENGKTDSTVDLENKLAATANNLVNTVLGQITAIIDALAKFANLSEEELGELRGRVAFYSKT